MSSKKGKFVSIRHNDLHDFTARIISEVCEDTEIELKLLPLYGEELHGKQQIDQMRPGLTLEHEDFGIEVNRHFLM